MIGEIGMGRPSHNVLNTEHARQQLIDELNADSPDWAEQAKPGSFGCHELLDRTALVADTLEQYILTHPACVQHKDWYVLAEQAVLALRELYQQIGAEHLDDA
jgi:hypothetical protein